MNDLVSKDFFDKIWKINVHLLRGKFKKWTNQRCYFIAADNSFIWKVLEKEIKDPNDLPKDHIIVNAIYTGCIWRKPEGWETRKRFTIMEFRDVIYEWINRKGEYASSRNIQIFKHSVKNNKKFKWAFTVEEVLVGGLTLKRIKAGFASVDRSLAVGVRLLEAL